MKLCDKIHFRKTKKERILKDYYRESMFGVSRYNFLLRMGLELLYLIGVIGCNVIALSV